MLNKIMCTLGYISFCIESVLKLGLAQRREIGMCEEIVGCLI